MYGRIISPDSTSFMSNLIWSELSLLQQNLPVYIDLMWGIWKYCVLHSEKNMVNVNNDI